MKTRLQALSTVVVLGIAFTLSLPAFAGGKEGTLTGTVSDAMCGAKHTEGSTVTLTVGKLTTPAPTPTPTPTPTP